MGGRGAAAVAVGLVVALGGAGCATGSGGDGDRAGDRGRSPSEGRDGERRDRQGEIVALLKDRARALERADGEAYAATSAPWLRPRDRRAARRAAGLGLHRVEFRLTGGRIVRDRALVKSRLTYRVRGVSGAFGSPVTLKLRRGGDERWRVTSIRSPRQRPPWEVGRFERTRSRHFVVWGPAGIDLESAGLSATLEDGYDLIRRALTGFPLRSRYLVLVARDVRQARGVTSAITGLGSLTALTDTEARESGPAREVRSIASQRLVVLWPAFSAIDSGARRVVVTHELAHAALAPETSGRTPAWLTEGMALYVSGDRRLEEAGVVARASRGELSLTDLNDPDAVASLSGDAQAAAYAYSSAAGFYIAERFGRRRLLALYEAFNDHELSGEPGDRELVDSAVRKVLGVSLRRLDRDVRAWVGG